MTFLRKSNFRGSTLLSQVEGERTKEHVSRTVDQDDSSDDPLSTSEVTSPKKRKRPEPATDDEPISSSDESEQLERSSVTPGPKRRPRAVWSPIDLVADSTEATPKPRKRAMSTPKTGERRSKRISTTQETDTSKDLSNRSATSRLLSETSMFFQRTPKRSITYTHKHPKSVPRPVRAEKKPEFIVPRGEPYGSSPGQPQKHADHHEFKVPRALPNDIFSGSSIPTDSSREIVESVLFDDGSGSSSPLSSVAPSNMDLTTDEKRWLDASPEDFVRCPACNALLDPEYLAEFELIQGLSIKKQMQVCRQHKRWTAERDWRLREYPTINWESLENRLHKYFADLEKILTRKRPSFFRNYLETSNPGNSKRDNYRLTANSQFEMMSSGYYGPRGSRMMMDSIIMKFATKIRHLAPSDPLMQATGVSGFVQAVLVPELTVMLVRDDMGVDDENARQIMRDSSMIGNLLNEQPDDIVIVDECGNSQN
ncbi:predicted protein [Uncinocarpus reesii 1704]|uniref:Restriction of telomere capping protein 4 n=1 Tax=Uncinocarpus reesii (strain UAMH 1704) TaxID=336963 RepID=C4JJL4_UNCRE|nr:uncharacterized protein UREG_01821 [Uncinocarpus reesii 1704]EEP76972.1 predicted protein [Uncinocarpus reesii 1704]